MSVAVLGMGAVSALGIGCGPLRDALFDARDGLRPLQRFPTDPFRAHLGGTVEAFDEPAFGGGPGASALCVRFATLAIREALGQAGLEVATVGPRALLVMGASQVHGDIPVHTLVAETRGALGWPGPALTVSTACSSSTAAIALAVAALRLGLVDLAVAGGADVLVPELYGGFDALGLLTKEKCTPFGTSFGTTLGEGAGFFVLRRGEGHVRVLGYGLSNDAWHETGPHPQGEGLAVAIGACVRSAGLLPADIDYVNAHGTGTEANDAAEILAVTAALGRLPRISSTKGVLGHAQAAAGSLEAITTVLGMQAGQVPPSVRAEPRRARVPDGVVARPAAARINRALCNSAAFGGSNAVIALGLRSDAAPPSAARPVYWAGAGAVGRQGRGLAALHAALDGAGVPEVAALPSLAGVRVDPRTLDPAGHLLTRAVADALVDAGLRVTRENRDRVGLIGGAVHVSPTTRAAFHRSIAERGVGHPAAAAFARMVLNAPAGAASRALGLRGAHTLVTTGEGSGLAAVVTAVMLLADTDANDALLAGVVDEAAPTGADGAAVAVLGVAPTGVRVRVALGPDEAAVVAALGPAEWSDVPSAPASLGTLGSGPAVDGVHRCFAAVRAVRAGAASARVVERGPLGALGVRFDVG